MTTLAELIKQKEILDEQIAKAKQTEKKDAISKLKALVAENNLTQQDIFGKAKKNINHKNDKGN